MIHILEPLALIPGVRVAVLVTEDGVPVAVRGRISLNGKECQTDRRQTIGEDIESLSGLATSWYDDIARAGTLLSWNTQRRAVLRATRGTIAMLGAPGAVLLVVLETGASPEELRLPMEGAVARMYRVLRNMGGGKQTDAGTNGALPRRHANSGLNSADSKPQVSPGEVGQIGN